MADGKEGFGRWLETQEAAAQALAEQTSIASLEATLHELLEKLGAAFRDYRHDPTPVSLQKWVAAEESYLRLAVSLRQRKAGHCHPDDTVD